MSKLLTRLWSEEEGQDIAEYAVMLAVILVIVVGTTAVAAAGNSSAQKAQSPLWGLLLWKMLLRR